MAIDHSFCVTSSYAVKVDPVTKQESQYTSDVLGTIEVSAGDVLRFKHYSGTGYVALNELLLHAVTGNICLTINDNNRYRLIVPEGDTLGISSMAIYSLTICEACAFRYEGLAG